MEIQELQRLYAQSPQVKALAKAVGNSQMRTVRMEGLMASATPMVFSALALKASPHILFVLQDEDEANYFYHDLCQLMGDGQVLLFPSSYRRAIKYAQRDAANEILRTEVLSRLSTPSDQSSTQYIVTHPEALAELVVTRKSLDGRKLTLSVGESVRVESVLETMRDLGFEEVDYVYEPGQFALRGSILDVFSFSHELPYRIDFFGDEVDTIRTFEVEDQLSKARCDKVDIVPELTAVEEKESLIRFLPADMLLCCKDFDFVRDTINELYKAGFSPQAVAERLENAPEMEREALERQMRRELQIVTATQFEADCEPFRRILLSRSEQRGGRSGAAITFDTVMQPLFHKNFDLLKTTLEDYRLKGYTLYILADSQKQQE